MNEMKEYHNNPFPHLIIDNFISKDYCDSLINDAKSNIENYSNVIHGGRNFLPRSSEEFKKLIAKSRNWKELERKINSKEFYEKFIKKIITESPTKDYAKWLTKKSIYLSELPSITNFLNYRNNLKWKRLINSKVNSISSLKLFQIILINQIDNLYRILVSIFDNFKNKRRFTLLYDYSISNEGYEREIHRDSDSRVIVFLLYLSSIEDDIGGNLEIFELLKKKKLYDPLPQKKSVSKISEIKPMAGRMVIFLNTSNAYHAVSHMQKSKFGRHFIYGGFTLSSSLFSLAKVGSSKSLATDYHIYQ